MLSGLGLLLLQEVRAGKDLRSARAHQHDSSCLCVPWEIEEVVDDGGKRRGEHRNIEHVLCEKHRTIEEIVDDGGRSPGG